MFFILEHKEGCKLNQLGIVVADSPQDAVTKIGAKVIGGVEPPESAVRWIELEDGYSLMEVEEITSLPPAVKQEEVSIVEEFVNLIKAQRAHNPEVSRVADEMYRQTQQVPEYTPIDQELDMIAEAGERP